MKIAVPTRDGRVDDHFGHCESYTIYTTDTSNNIVGKVSLPSPQGCGCKSNIASVLQDMGVTVMLAGNMGAGALNKLSAHGIKVYRGCSGDTTAVLEAFIAGAIADSGESCKAHSGDHQCQNHG